MMKYPWIVVSFCVNKQLMHYIKSMKNLDIKLSGLIISETGARSLEN